MIRAVATRRAPSRWPRGSSPPFPTRGEGRGVSICRRERLEAALKIGDEIGHVFEPDVKTDRRAARRPLRCRAHRGAVKRNSKAHVATPRGADAEQRQCVKKGMHGTDRRRLEHDAKQAACPGEIAFP